MDRRDVARIFDLSKSQQTLVLALLLALLALAAWRLWEEEAWSESLATIVPSPEAAAVKIDVNSAAWHDLVVLPGIGPRLAQRIIAVRDAKEGRRFQSLDEIVEARGVSAKLVERVRPYLCMGQQAEQR